MSNPKSAANAWAGIKKKLTSAQGDDAAATNGKIFNSHLKRYTWI
jgi:hypothetical protein